MANLARVRVVWTGSPVIGGGVSTFYVSEAATGFVADLRAFFETCKNVISTGTLIDVESSGDLIDVATGALSGSWSDTGAAQVVALGSGAYVAGTGARVSWATSGIRNGRRVRGTTFLAPLIGAAFDADGTPAASVITTISGAANTLRAALPGELQIYSRPSGGLPGQASTVIDSSVPNQASWLRSRRT